MSSGSQMRGMQGAIKRLKAVAGKGRRCAHCRLTVRCTLPDPKTPQPLSEDMIKVRCQFCRHEYHVPLAGLSGIELEANRLFFSYTIEDQYRDPKAHAVGQWLRHDPKPRSQVKRRPSARAKDNPNARALAKLREEANKLFERRHKTLRSKYGASPFPEQMELIEAVEDRQRHKGSEDYRTAGLSVLREAETNHLIRAELEKIIWGRTSTETAAAIERLDSEIKELIVTESERVEREKEERRLKDLAFLNNNRAMCGLPPLPDDYGKS